MNSLEITAYKAYVAHRKAFDTWENGNIDKVWMDDNKNICIKYTSGKWWHYSVSQSGDWMWWYMRKLLNFLKICLAEKDPFPWGIYETSLTNVPPEVLRELEEMVDNRRKQLLRR